jgi:phosphate transport system substrate-binding protein
MVTVACSNRYGRPHDAASQKTVVVRGSDTMLTLLQRWAEQGAEVLEGASIQVTGGGSGTGLRALADGTADVAAASRRIEPEEQVAIQRRGHGEAVEHVVAIDAVALYVHPSNPVPALSLDDARALYRGRVDRWSMLGGPDLPVVLYGRESSSGTYAFFKERVLHHDDYAAEVQSLPGTSSVLQAVARDRGAIGYAGLGVARGVRVVPIRGRDGVVVQVDKTAVREGRYPLARPLYLYTAGTPRGPLARWIAWIRSPVGQRDTERAGFVAIAPESPP